MTRRRRGGEDQRQRERDSPQRRGGALITRLLGGKPTASAEGSLAVRRGGGAGEYLNGKTKNLHSLSLYLNG